MNCKDEEKDRKIDKEISTKFCGKQTTLNMFKPRNLNELGKPNNGRKISKSIIKR